jgi:hypothetical protein
VGLDLMCDVRPHLFIDGKLADGWELERLVEKLTYESEEQDGVPHVVMAVIPEILKTDPPPEDHLRMAYRGFSGFRRKLAANEGINLDHVWGFAPHEEGTAAYVLWCQTAIRWDFLTTPLKLLLSHSDCDGEMTPAECATVVGRLAEILDYWEAKEPDPAFYLEQGRRLVAQMKWSVRTGRKLLFQ